LSAVGFLRYLIDAFLHIVYSVVVLFSRRFILVDVRSQKLYLYAFGWCIQSYDVSTSRNGVGEAADSFKTPRGWFSVVDRFGDGSPANMTYRGRKPAGLLEDDRILDNDPILARILWLSGRQLSNANTYGRYIYIHGTRQERMVSRRPLSLGCVNLGPVDMIELYLNVACTRRPWVLIVDSLDALPWQPYFFNL